MLGRRALCWAATPEAASCGLASLRARHSEWIPRRLAHLPRLCQCRELPADRATVPSRAPLGRRYATLEEVAGKVAEVAQDQNGCRFLQKKFDEGGPAAISMVFAVRARRLPARPQPPCTPAPPQPPTHTALPCPAVASLSRSLARRLGPPPLFPSSPR